MKKFKTIFVGENEVGKTTLLITYDLKYLPEKYLPTAYDDFSKIYKIEENKEIEIEFWDKGMSENNDNFTRFIYDQTDVIAICFAIDNRSSFQNIESFWILEIEHYSPNSKIILIGTKIDLRNNEERINELKEENQKLITKEEGMDLAKKIKAIKYFECSSLNQKGIETIFNEIMLICIGKYDGINQEKQKKKGCILN
ncbi:rac1 [Anaeramoeba ignava]|uniref:Rac1 n=1 Tax=Anaeramoeba ignava TaxID=1746090 RepID=A0A9Q0RDY2_ANAIG|nr:rac1 [Anaeramoeba ignava]